MKINSLKKLWEIAVEKGEFVRNYLSTALLGNMKDSAITEVYAYRLPCGIESDVFETQGTVEIPRWFVEKIRKASKVDFV
jgi:hypothetical protein